jgi:hypothetical protein
MFEPGMVFAFNMDLLDPKWRGGQTGCVFAEPSKSRRRVPAGCTRIRLNFSGRAIEHER